MSLAAQVRATLNDTVLRSVIAHGTSALLIKLAAAALSFLMFVVIANSMSPSEYGKFAFGFSLAIALSTIAGLGLGTAVLRFLPQYAGTGEHGLARGFILAAGTASIIVPVLTGVALALGIKIYTRYWPGSDLDFIFMAALLIPVMTASEFVACALRAQGLTIASMAPRDIVWRAAVAGLAFLAIHFGFQLDSGGMLLLASLALLAILIGQLFYARFSMGQVIVGRSSQQDYPLWIKTLLPMWGAASLYALVQQFDVVILGLFLSPEDSGSYFAALRTAGLLSLLLIAGNMVSAPLIAKYYHNGDRVMLQKLVRLLTAGIAIPTLAGLLFLALIGGWLLRLFDPSFVSAYPILLILGIGFTFDAAAGPTGYMLQMVGKENAYLKIMACAYAVTLGLQCIFIPLFGAYGAAIPNALGLILANIFIIRTVKRELGIDPSLIGLLRS
ncbi:MAG: polysaccharide biosynthesis C-terminal domain-containing protein [Aestuariivirga sp.]